MLPAKRLLRPADLYEYPEHLREQIASTPKAAGVYLFYGDSDVLPLYIGKSVDIRARLLTHLRTPQEARLLRQARRIEHIRTAGEIGALLLESRLIKERQPLYNKRLRHQRRLSSIRLSEGRPEIVEAVLPGRGQPLYGLFRNRRAASEHLLAIADRHLLCHGLLGLERHTPGRACFRIQIGRCAGACVGRESREAHAARLLAALAEREVFCCVPGPGRPARAQRGAPGLPCGRPVAFPRHPRQPERGPQGSCQASPAFRCRQLQDSAPPDSARRN